MCYPHQPLGALQELSNIDKPCSKCDSCPGKKDDQCLEVNGTPLTGTKREEGMMLEVIITYRNL
jgi:hypothetical protein